MSRMKKIDLKKDRFKAYKKIMQRYRECTEALGYDWNSIPEKNRKQAVIKEVEFIESVLDNGLDIGTIIKQVVPVQLIWHEEGLYFYSPDKSTYYPVEDCINNQN